MTVKKITKPIKLLYDDKTIELPEDLKLKIKDFWMGAIKETPALYNGEDFVVVKIEEQDNEIIMHIMNTDYAHYLYDERIGINNKKFRCIAPWVGILLLTNDGYWIVGEMNGHTSFPNGIQLPGGGIDKKDIKDKNIDIQQALKRELKEEINLSLDKIKYDFGYLELPNKKRNACGLIAVGELCMSKDELKAHFDAYKTCQIKNNLKTEFKKLIFLEQGKATQKLKLYNAPKREYLLELFTKI